MSKSNTLKLFVLAVVIAAGFTVCLHCGHGPEPRGTKITGTVTDSLTGTPIDSAQVVIGDTLTSLRVFYTNAQGNYTAYSGSFVVQIFCRKDTYRTRQRTMDLSSNRDVYRNVNFELQPH